MNNSTNALTQTNVERYVPTEEDRRNDQLQQEWKEQRNEQARQAFIRDQYRTKKYAM